MVDIECVAQAEIESQGIKLRHRPDGIDIYLGPDDHVLLGVDLGQVDVVVIFHTKCGANAEPDRAHQQVIGNVLDILPARFRGRFSGQRGPNHVLRSSNRRCAQERKEKNEGDALRGTIHVSKRWSDAHRGKSGAFTLAVVIPKILCLQSDPPAATRASYEASVSLNDNVWLNLF